jgi:hypothetical protein
MPRRILIGVGAMAAAMAVASLAYACTVITGFTWYASGSPSSGPTGTNITAFATEARANRSFKLVVGNTNTPGHEDHACMDNVTDINSNVRISSSSGFIGNTSGPINKPAGTWQVCFYEVTAGAVGASATFPVSFTVV